VGKIVTLDYAEMANRVYEIGRGVRHANHRLDGYKADLFEEGMNWGATKTNFKGCVYVSQRHPEVVVAFQGTDLGKAGDLLADLQIAIGGLVGMLPQYCSAALRLFDRTRAIYPARAVSFVGHSLGGAMAQIMGHWTGLPFVTFNAPGMWGDIQKSKLILSWSPSNSLRSIQGTFKGSLLAKQMATTGRNFRNILDPVSAYGFHYGPVTRFVGLGLHSMDDLLQRIKNSHWRDKNPFDPAHKEWGEL
jgi:hypothetical protein